MYFEQYKECKKLTVKFHVAHLKLSHVYTLKIILFMCYMYRIYGNKLVVHRGKVHDYLGINFDLSEKGKVKIDMNPLLENILESFP